MKCEELNSELDLKFHLHQPRPHRAELDVHNVRAAELVMHAERITRHCSGMDQSLTELRSRFKAMSQDHSKLAYKFKEEIEALEDIFVNATKSARLVKLQNQVTMKLDTFMSVIRTSLRQFRQHLDETLQALRESNARFIKSFKVFSDGGNFCPEEIIVYRKKLEKMSLMIDGVEGSIMSELEGMESKHLESATKVAVDFEDRFKNHMGDLVFMESVTRWLTNTQVNIKTEVSSSNTQAKTLVQMLNDLHDRLAAYDKPNLNREVQITPAELYNTLLHIFDAFIRRSKYLHCGKISSNTGDEMNSSGAIKNTNETNFEKEFKLAFAYDGKSSRTALDPSVGIIKSIIQCIEMSKSKFCEKQRTQASKRGFELNTDLDGDVLGLVSEKSKPLMPQTQTLRGSDSGKSIHKGADNIRETTNRKSQIGRLSKLVKLDRKYITTDEKQDDKYFLAAIQHTLSESLDGLLATAEVYYHQKGTRSTTRSQSIAETFEQCADLLSQKMQSYFYQADEYRNHCLQEFRGQLVRLEQLCARVPNLMIANLLKMETEQLENSQNKLSEGFNITLCHLTDRQKLSQKQLCPILGHPHHEDDLAALCAQEKVCNEEYLEAVTQHIRDQQECVLEYARIFLEKLVKSAEFQLQLYDGMLTIDDIEKGRSEPKLYPTCDLLRRHKADKPPLNEEDKDFKLRGRASWIGVPNNQFVIGNRPSTLEVTPTVETCKTTLAHAATVDSRDKAYQDYKQHFDRKLKKIEEMNDKLLTAQKNWEQLWEISVKKITSLYNKNY